MSLNNYVTKNKREERSKNVIISGLLKVDKIKNTENIKIVFEKLNIPKEIITHTKETGITAFGTTFLINTSDHNAGNQLLAKKKTHS